MSKRQHLKNKCWNFIFYKFISIFGVLNVHSERGGHVVLWFAKLSLMHLMIQSCKDRFECLFSHHTNWAVMTRFCGCWSLCCSPLWNSTSVLLLAASMKCTRGFQAAAWTTHVIQLWDFNHERMWEGNITQDLSWSSLSCPWTSCTIIISGYLWPAWSCLFSCIIHDLKAQELLVCGQEIEAGFAVATPE